MPSILNPYLSFQDTAGPAMAFYQSVFGGELTTSTFGEAQMTQDPAQAGLIMHAQLVVGDGFVLMGADTPEGMELTPNGSISLSGDDEAELRGYWDKLMEGGSVAVPLEPAPWGDTFGMGSDKFGVAWLVNIAGQGAPQA